jgi:hypothetical protein
MSIDYARLAIPVTIKWIFTGHIAGALFVSAVEEEGF